MVDIDQIDSCVMQHHASKILISNPHSKLVGRVVGAIVDNVPRSSTKENRQLQEGMQGELKSRVLQNRMPFVHEASLADVILRHRCVWSLTHHVRKRHRVSVEVKLTMIIHDLIIMVHGLFAFEGYITGLINAGNRCNPMNQNDAW